MEEALSEECRQLTRDERDGAEQVISAVFGENDSSLDQPACHVDPWRDQERMFGCLVDGRVVSVVHLMRRKAYVNGGQWSFGAIAGVSTLPEFRSRGYSSKLMRLAAEKIIEDGHDFGLLGTDINPFYEKLGWFDVPKTSMAVDISGPISLELTAEVDADIPWQTLAPIYEAFNTDRPFAVVRTPEYWRGWAETWFKGTTRLLVRDGSEAVAYAIVRSRPDKMDLEEVGWLPDCSDVARQLANQLLALADSWHVNRIEGEDVPYEENLVRGLERPGVSVHKGMCRSMMAMAAGRSVEELKAQGRLLEDGAGLFWLADAF